MNEGETNEEVEERVKKLITRNFYISKCPEDVYVEFSNFAKKETMDNYALGLKMLLDRYKANAKELMLYNKYLEIDERLIELEGNQDDGIGPVKGFGSGGK